jgi:TP901 family phage tail tape measure protein
MAATVNVIVKEDGIEFVKKNIASLGKEAEGAGGGFSSLKEVATGALREVGSLAVDALGKAASAVGGFLKDSVSAASGFQSGMLEFQAVAGKGVDTTGLQQFHDLFISLGKELPVSTADVQKAAIELVKGGIDPATVAAGGLEQTIKFAAAAMGGDLSAAAEVSAKVVGGWAAVTATAQEKADLLTHSTDLLTKAANASTVDVHDLALGLYNVQGTAKTMGMTLDETTTTLAELAPRFSSANTAGSSLRNMMVRLQPTTKSATAAMEALGLITADGSNKFFDAQGKFVGVAKASDLLKNALVGMTDADRTMALQTVFGNDAMNAAAALADMGATGYNNMAAAMENANGVSGNAALKQQGLSTAMDNFKGSIEALQITVGEVLLPVLTDLFNNVLSKGVNIVTDFATAIFSADDPILALVQSVDALAPGLGSVIGYLAAFITEGDSMNDFLTTTPPLFQTVVDFIQTTLPQAIDFVNQHWEEFKGALIALGAVLAGAAVAGAIVSLAATIASLMNPITLIIVGAALLGAAWAGDWGGIQEKTAAVWAVVQPIFNEVVTWLQTNIPIAIQTASDFWTNTLKPALEAVWAFIKDSVIPTIGNLANGAFDALNAGTKSVADFWNNTLKPALNAVWSFLNTYVIPLVDALSNVYFAVLKNQTQAVSDAWNNTLKPAFAAVSSFIDQTVMPIWNTLNGTALGETLSKSTEVSSFFNNTLKPAFAAIGGVIKDVVQVAVDNFLSSWNNMVGGFSALGGYVKDAISWLNKLADAIGKTPSMPSSSSEGAPPKFAKGVENFGGGLAYVHAGEILMNLRRGTSVIPAGRSHDILNQQSTTNVYNLNFAPNYSGQPSERMDLGFAKSLAGVL